MNIDTLNVTKMSGAGNLFIVIDNNEVELDFRTAQRLVVPLCEKFKSADFDSEGVMYICNSQKYDFEVWFFNPDGSSGMMCGNGGRCAVRYADKKRFINDIKNIRFYMANQEYEAKIIDNIISIFLPPIKSIEALEDPKKGFFIDNGTQHYCINILEYEDENLEQFPLNEIGPQMRYHERFAPLGTNFNIYQIEDEQTIRMRTYERGVEKETGACGTGAIAAAYSAKESECKFPIKVIPTSGIPIIVDFDYLKQKICLSGHAEIIG